MNEAMRSYHVETLQNGSPASRMRSAIALIGYNKGAGIELGTVISASPLRIQVDGMSIELEADDLVLDRSVTDHDVNIRYSDGTSGQLTILGALKAADRVIVVENGQTFYVLGRAGGGG